MKGYLHGPDPKARPVFEAEGLRVDVASPRYLLAMKLRAARPEDAEDIRLLYDLCGFTRAKEGLDLVRSAYPGTVPARVRFMAEELLPNRCSVCGRPLRAPESIARGAGPRCARR